MASPIEAQDPLFLLPRPQVDYPDPALRSTPQARGLATVSENIGAVGVRPPDICPWIQQDLEKFEACHFDRMLVELLVDCIDDGLQCPDELSKQRLFEDCLAKVLPICNGEVQAHNKTTRAKSSEIKEKLEAYSKGHATALENTLYPPFVAAANAALLFLEEIDIPHIRPSRQVCFQVHGSVELKQVHQGQVSARKPDVILVSESAARDAEGSSEDIYTQKDFLLGVATHSPKKAFQWRDVRTFLEFKKSRKKIPPPPKSYTREGYEYIPPLGREYLKMNQPDLGAEHVPPVPCSTSHNEPEIPPCPSRRSVRQQEKAMATGSNGRKRAAENGDSPTSPSKRPKPLHKLDTLDGPTIVQAGYYAIEMFASHIGRLHVLGIVIVDDILYLWWYDRQGTIQCSGLNFIQDLPLFLVLLFAMQRFDDRHWGLNPILDPKFGTQPRQQKTTLRGQEGEIVATLELSGGERVGYFGLGGRATNVCPITSDDLPNPTGDDLVVKITWAESTRMSEAVLLERVHQIAMDDDDVKGHIPDMLWHATFQDMSTAMVRERLGLKMQGTRILRMIIFRKLKLIIELVGDEFLHAWWAAAKCHLALWKKGIYHCDITASNLMYYKNKKGSICGVLNDFDLATTVLGTATGTERTGAAAFMAMDLINPMALRGGTKHEYSHDVESFIWVLVWISLCCDAGQPHGLNAALDRWLRVDAHTCRDAKWGFLWDFDFLDLRISVHHQRNWDLARECLEGLRARVAARVAARHHHAPTSEVLLADDVDAVFESLIQRPASQYLKLQ